MAHHDLELRIDHLALDLPALPGGEHARRALVEAALKRLGERLASSRSHRSLSIETMEIELLGASALTQGELLGPRGAERLADALYSDIVRRLG